MTHTHGELPQIKNGSHIGLLGGSFDPPHIGHQLLALSFLALERIDELWIVPCSRHAFKGSLSSFSHRLAMCNLAFLRIHDVHVLDIENYLKAPNYTLQTIEHILNHLPSINLHLGIGSDLVSTFAHWHGAEELVQKVRMVIFERDSHPIMHLPVVLKSAHVHRGYVLPDINSTTLRSQSRLKNVDDPFAYVDRNVARYVDEHNLYR
jgi:nicotinate-nucleotide adenylyltransferase